MTDRIAVHETFTLERRYFKRPSQVYSLWSDPAAKARWFAGENAGEHALDFRVGGLETLHGRDADGHALTFESRYHDIVPGERIVYAGTLLKEGAPITVSLTTVQFRPVATGTVLLLTEQAAYLDGHEQPEWRESGTADWLDALGRELQAQH
jgi:uncharacterized protein YndB with AHSA1/START domain